MSYVITQKCVSEVYASCVDVCPVDCIHFVDTVPQNYPDAGKPTMIIDPDECISCAACLPECPIGAIVESEEEDPEWARINLELTPLFKGKKTVTRDKKDPPRRPDNHLV